MGMYRIRYIAGLTMWEDSS